jgi:hypothetical protein
MGSMQSKRVRVWCRLWYHSLQVFARLPELYIQHTGTGRLADIYWYWYPYLVAYVSLRNGSLRTYK